MLSRITVIINITNESKEKWLKNVLCRHSIFIYNTFCTPRLEYFKAKRMEEKEKIFLLAKERRFQKWKNNPESTEEQEISIEIGKDDDESNVSGLDYFIYSNDHNEYYGSVYLELNLEDLREIRDNLDKFIKSEEVKDETLKKNTKRDYLREGYIFKLLERE
jgi:hypothetical protein